MAVEPYYACLYCTKTFQTLRLSKSHRMTHERSHYCDMCEKAFPFKSTLENHKNRHKRRSLTPNCPWPRCRFSGVVNKWHLVKHMKKNDHSEKARLWRQYASTETFESLKLYAESLDEVSFVPRADQLNLSFLEAPAAEHAEEVAKLPSGRASIGAKEITGRNAVTIAVENGYEATIKALQDNSMEFGPEQAAAQSTEALHAAVKSQNTNVAELLLSYGADVNTKDSHLRTPLALAINLKLKGMIKLLLDHGADTSTHEYFDAILQGEDDLHSNRGMKDEQGAIVKLMLDAKAPVNVSDKHTGQTVLHEAVFSRNETCVRMILEAGADVDARDIWNRTALHYAAGWDRYRIKNNAPDEAIILILLRAGATIDRKDDLQMASTMIRAWDFGLLAPLMLKKLDSGVTTE